MLLCVGPLIQGQGIVHIYSDILKSVLVVGVTELELPVAGDVANLQIYKIASSQFAIDRQIEQRAIAKARVVVEIEANSPNVFRSEGAFGVHILSSNPGVRLVNSWVKVRISHGIPPMA